LLLKAVDRVPEVKKDVKIVKAIENTLKHALNVWKNEELKSLDGDENNCVGAPAAIPVLCLALEVFPHLKSDCL
jgi:hypothetical protein